MFVSELAHGCSCCLPFFFFSRPIRFCDAFRRYKLSAVDVLRHYYRQAPIQSISYWYKTHLAIASVKHPIRKRFAPRRKTRSDTHIHLFRLFLRNFAHSPSFFCFGCRAGVVASMAPTTTTGSHNSSDAKPDLDVRVTSSNARNKERSLRTELYPHIKCFNSGYLPVSKLHTLYWEESGNATGQVSRLLVHDQKKEMDQKKRYLVLWRWNSYLRLCDEKICFLRKCFLSFAIASTIVSVKEIGSVSNKVFW